MWEQEQKMDDPAVIEQVLREAGLAGARILERINEPLVKETLLKNTQQSFERGAFGSPTFFVNDEIYFGKDSLRDVEEEIKRCKAS
ncbi:DSBA-like thioredoxin domain protein [compost metagenome]